MYKRLVNIAGWAVFVIATIVYYLTAERTGSLWDCGEFIAGAYKLEVVHPPGAPFFLLVGRMFTWVAELLSDDPADIAFSVNMLSGLVTAAAAMFVAWSTMILIRMAMKGRDAEPDTGETYAIVGGGFVAGLATALCSSIWFSAVEGEVYAMSLMFTCLTLWAVMKWYSLPDTPRNDRWLIFAVYSSGLSIGVHLLSILTFPALAIFYYFKKYKNPNFMGIVAASAVGMALIVFIQQVIIAGIPVLWAKLELTMVNGMGLPFYSGLIPLLAILVGIFYFLINYSRKKGNHLVEMLTIGALVTVIGYSTFGVVVIRAEANTPINMNAPSDAMRLIPYLNREQYGERQLLRGPLYTAKPDPRKTETEQRYGRLGDKYAIVDEKVSYGYKNSDKVLFPRMSDGTQGRPNLYKQWVGKKSGNPTMGDNLSFMFNYQIGWMYMRYFMWNFVGRENFDQGLYSWNKKDGQWLSGITPLDEARLYNMEKEPASRADDKGRNKYYFIPLIFGLIGMFFHFKKRPNDALGLFALFIITGIGIIIYSNQPPNEPRERDYVLVGSFFTFCMWIGMSVPFFYELFKEKMKLGAVPSSAAAIGLIMIAPILMGTQNFDDHNRNGIYASRDYATNFLNSCEKNAIIFTYGDNDTYPLWYAQEVEGIRTDVRVVNLSLIAVDWYINQLRRKVNDSPAIKMSVSAEAIRGKKRNVIYHIPNGSGPDKEMTLDKFLGQIGSDNPRNIGNGRKIESYFTSRNLYIPVDKNKMLQNGVVGIADTANMVNRIPVKIGDTKTYILKDDIAILDIIASNIHERPVYYAVTCRPDNMFGLQDYMQLEGLSLRLVPVKSKSERQYSTMGNGRVAGDIIYDNIMNKWKWGNLDKEEHHVNHSYGPSIQSHRISILRAAEKFAENGDSKRAVDLIDKYFEGFPKMNFTYDYNAWMMANVYLKAGAYDKAKPVMEDIAAETAKYLEFYYSLDPIHLEGDGFGRDFQFTMRTKDELLRAAKTMGDKAMEDKFNAMFAAYSMAPVNN